MQKKKVLIIAGSLKTGGAEKVARDIALYSDPKRYAFHYIVFGEEVGEYEAQLLALGCRIFHFEEPSSGYLHYIKELFTLMGKQRYAAVHAHTMFSCGWAMAVGKWAGIPVRIAHAHSALADGDGLVKSIYEAVMRFLIRRCATELVACAEPAGVRLFGRKAWEARGTLIPNGVDTSAFAFCEEDRRNIRARYGLEGRFVIGHAGHLNSVKNQQFLLELLPALLALRPDACLLLLGEGEDRKMLENRIRKLGLENRVILTGNVPDVAAHLSAMDVFALPSLYEGMPLALLEARCNGLPCVISDSVPGEGKLPLSEPQRWIDAICQGKRSAGDKVPDIRSAMKAIYERYEKG